jgi:hypothetical protein
MRISILLLLIAISVSAIAQQRGKTSNSLEGVPISERIFFGGGGGFSGGTSYGFRYTSISVSPLVGYRLTVPWAAGVGVNYTYVRYPDVDVTLTQYGVSPFTQYRFGNLFAYAEYSVLSVPTFDNSSRSIYNRLPVGLGYTMPIGGRAALNMMALYDVLYDARDGVFGSPWVIRVFFTAGGISI